jgi:hypothetical protein
VGATSDAADTRACPWFETDLVVAGVPLDDRAPWFERFRVANYETSGNNSAADALGNTYLAGTFTGTVTFGATALCATSLPQGYGSLRAPGGALDTPCRCVRDYADVFLVKLGPTGVPAWARRVGGALEDRAGPVVVDGHGNVVAAVATTRVTGSATARFWSLYGYDAAGQHLWTRPLMAPTVPLLAVAPSGAILVAEANASPPGIRLMSIEAHELRPDNAPAVP